MQALATHMLQRSFRPSVRAFSSISIDIPKIDVHRLEQSEMPTKAETSKEELMEYFHDLAYCRRIEIVSDSLYKAGLIRGFCHLYDGQEAVAVGMAKATTFKDPLIAAYRVHAIAVMRGDTHYGILAEMMQKKTGSSEGKGGSMHYYNTANQYYGGNGIVGAQIPVGTGLAFALKYEGNTENVAMIMYGDGAANQGQLYEASNMAGIWSLPAVFVIENNRYAMGTSTERAALNQDYYKRGDLIPGIKADGHNIFAVREAMAWAKKYSSKNGPLFLEFETYRYHGHSMSDPGVTYRNREEVNEVRKTRDPIELVREIILSNKFADAKELKAIEKEIRKTIEDDVEKIKNDPEPTAEDLYAHVAMGTSGKPYIRGVEKHLSQTDY